MTRPNRIPPFGCRKAIFSIQVGFKEACWMVLADGQFGCDEAWADKVRAHMRARKLVDEKSFIVDIVSVKLLSKKKL